VKARGRFDLPPELEPVMERAKRLEWLTIGALAAIVIAIYFTMGSSQAMKAAWIEDLLSFVTPIAFLISARYRHGEPNDEFPYGYHRSVNIAFLAGAVALTLFGTFILFDSAISLVQAHHPTLGTTVLLGRQLWSGWLMIGVLFLSGIPPFILGRMKLKPARQLHDKTLKADADMNRADWLTAISGIVGILGIGIGWWWADAAAGAVISLGIVKDGVTNLRQAAGDLLDRSPLTVDGEPSETPGRVREALLKLPWVRTAEVRLREEGHVFTGELFLTTAATADLSSKVEEARRTASRVDWRVHDVVVELEDHPE
jgi:cation diffusion facilitator family transporter